MKRLIKRILFVALALTLALSMFACGDIKYIKYNESGLNFELPEYMKELEVSSDYADIAYGTLDDRGVEFTIYFYSRDDLMIKLILDKDSTVKEYAEWFIGLNDYGDIDEDYDEEGCKITLKYVYEMGSDRYFFYDYIVRNEYMLYHVTMSCDPDDRSVYESTFDEWASRITLDY